MPQVGFEPTVPVFDRAITVHALDRAALVLYDCVSKICSLRNFTSIVMYFVSIF
jgi:hypothetical protein